MPLSLSGWLLPADSRQLAELKGVVAAIPNQSILAH